MNARRKLVTILAVLLGTILVLGPALAPAAEGKAPKSEASFTGPYTYKNLTIYLVHGPDQIKGKEFLTLQEALEQKKATVEETGNVNVLIVANHSNVHVYVHAGAIVKGGKQDRMIKDDYMVAPRSKQEIAVFCVEQGRWTGRGGESTKEFSSNRNTASGKELKLAARSSEEQGKVWSQVEQAQEKLSKNVGGDVRSGESGTSLQLSLEDKNVRHSIETYRKELGGILKDQKQVIGYAFAVNGKVSSVDIFGSQALFLKLWPQLLDSAVAEAVAEFDKDRAFGVTDEKAVKDFLDESRKAKAEEREVAKDTGLIRRESGKSANFVTVDKSEAQPAAVRESVVSKE